MSEIMQIQSDSQKKILDYLLDHPEGATLDELANYLDVTRTAAKEHVLKIHSLGYLTFVDSRGFVGRPKRKYIITPQGQEVFPRQYSWLSNVLLELLTNELGIEGILQVMNKLADSVANSMLPRFKKAITSLDLISEVVATLNELGYRVRLKQSDLRKGAVIEASNCVYHNIAKRHPELCQFDLRFIENVTNMNVKLESCIAKGEAVCRFCIRKSN